MTLCFYHQQRPKFRSLRWVLYVSLAITTLSITLLLWTYRPARTLQFWSQYYRPISRASVTVQNAQQTGYTPRQPRLDGKKVALVAISGTHTLLLSAYLEHRTALKEVRVIAVVLRSEAVAYRCLLRCQGQHHVSSGKTSIHPDHFNFVYGTAYIMCAVPSGCETPSHIAVTSVTAEYEDKSEKVFLEVLNQEERSDSFHHNFTVCLSTMFNFTNVLQLVQSMEMLQLLGVSRVVVYKSSCSPETQRLLDYYTHTGLMEVIPWSISSLLKVSRSWQPEHGPGDLHYYGQIPALNDCHYRYMYQTKYMALHDVDELILPQLQSSWKELLPVLEQEHGADLCYKFENFVFPNTVILPAPNFQMTRGPHSRWRGVSGVNILDHLYHEPLTTQFNNYKIIVNPRAVITLTVHGVLDSQKGCAWVDRNVGRMYHTRAPGQTDLTPDQLVYNDRLLDYSASLTLAVNAVLRETGLLPDDST